MMLNALRSMSVLSEEETADQDQRIYGVALAQVINNIDILGQGRVQLRLPWLPGLEPWARVVTFSAGRGTGAYFIPQLGDEVLVAFNQGDVRDPYVLGSLWNATDRPPGLLPTDPIVKRIIRTPLGHEIEIDDMTQTITIKTNTQQKVTLNPLMIEVSTVAGGAKMTLTTAGTISIEAKTMLELKAPRISLQAAQLELKGTANATLMGGGMCTIQGKLVKIN